MSWDLLRGLLLGVVGALLAHFARDLYDKRRARLTLLRALRVQARGATRAVRVMLDELRATQAHAEKVITSARAGTLDCDAVGELYAGWVLHIPGPALLDLLTKLQQREARDVMIYFDGLSRLAELEKRYGATHAKLVELTSKVSDKCYQTQILETANQLHGYLETLLVVGDHFLSEAARLRRHAMMSGCKPIIISGG